MSARTLFIGMDGATFTILDELAHEAGDGSPVMPFLSGIYRDGVRGKLMSTPNPLTPPAWVSLMTGKSPGNHGIFDFIRSEELGHDVFFTLYDARDCRAETIWSMISRQGGRFAALNFPFTAPPKKGLNGFLLPGFIPWRHLRRNTLPGDLYDRLKGLPGFNPRELAWDFEKEKNAINELTDEDREKWIRYHLPREKQWFRIARHLLAEENLDLMAVMFDGVDKLQHQAWVFMDPGLQTGETGEYHRRMRRLCMDYFAQLDGFIEKLVDAAGPDAQVFLASDHGFCATNEVVRINTYLQEKGYLAWKPRADTEEALRREQSMFANLDWNNTVAYCRTPSSNGITIRMARKPGESGVKPGEYDSFRNKLISDLEDLRDPQTGERVIAGIYKREAVFPGPAMQDAPDLLLVLRDCGFVSINNKVPAVEKRKEIAGTHHPEGVFLACGPGIRRGETVEAMDIVDVCATLLYSLGMEMPPDIEGKVPQSVFTDLYLAQHPVVMGDVSTFEPENQQGDSIPEDEKEQIMAQLRMLGYVQ